MPFDKAFRNIYAMVIKPVETECHVRISRADELPFKNVQIYDLIVEAIDFADVIIADLSMHNPNVFYELGYAHAKGKIVVPMSSDTLPFDVAGFPTILYDPADLPSLKRELARRLSEAISLRKACKAAVGGSFLNAHMKELEQVEQYAFNKARTAKWLRPGMYFTEAELIAKIQINRDPCYDVLNALRDLGKVTCVNWRGNSVWMASQSASD